MSDFIYNKKEIEYVLKRWPMCLNSDNSPKEVRCGVEVTPDGDHDDRSVNKV